MFESGREGAISAGFIALLGLAQAFLNPTLTRTPTPEGLRARLLNLRTGYFTIHLFVATTLFCVWKIPSKLSGRHLAFQLLLENAWIEGLGIMVRTELLVEADCLYS